MIAGGEATDAAEGDQSVDPAVLTPHREAGMPVFATQELGDRRPAVDGLDRVRHHIAHQNSGQCHSHACLPFLGEGHIRDEQPQQNPPQPLAASNDQLRETGGDEQVAESEPGARRPHGRLEAVSAPHPQRGAQHAATIQGSSGNEVEHSQQGVQQGQVGQRRHHEVIDAQPAHDPGQRAEHQGEPGAGGGPHHRDAEFDAGTSRFAPKPSEPAQQPQRDAFHHETVAAGHDRVREFVRQQRADQQNGSAHPGHGVREQGVPGQGQRQLVGGQPDGDEGDDADYAPVQPDPHPCDPPNRDRTAHASPRNPPESASPPVCLAARPSAPGTAKRRSGALGLADDYHRAPGVMHDVLADRTQQGLGESPVAPVADDDQVRLGLVCRVQQRACGMAFRYLLAHLHRCLVGGDLVDQSAQLLRHLVLKALGAGNFPVVDHRQVPRHDRGDAPADQARMPGRPTQCGL